MNLLATSFDLGNARACVRACADAYQQATVGNATTDTHCLVGEAPDCMIVAFRGTDSIRDWITDALFFRKLLVEEANGDQCEVHAGFLAAYESIIGDLSTFLGGSPVFKLQPCKPLFITGHSLGGALAILAALELKRQGFQIMQVYTFGQPRVGNGAFKKLYEWSLGAATFRVVHEEDIVPRVPHLPSFTDFYRHAGTEVLLSSLGGMVVNPPLYKLLASDAWGLYRAFCVSKFAAALDPINDHFVANYVADVNQLKEEEK